MPHRRRGGANGDIFVTDGSRHYLPADWVVDLMHKGRSGRLVHVDATGATATVVLDGLGFAHGVALTHDQQTAIVANTWKHHLLTLHIAARSRHTRRRQFPASTICQVIRRGCAALISAMRWLCSPCALSW